VRHVGRDENIPKGQELRAFIEDYLSEGHRDQRDVGCIIAALGGDIGRANAKQRKAFTEGIDITLERIAGYLPGATAAERRANAELLTSSMAGVVMVSRSLSDRARSNALLARAREYFSTAFGA
jgi:TetR/AcrR family transcriptional regulator, transcriptional repressor for nem operon